jgi:uncharacterized phage protein (TIGR02220 family)
MDRSRRKWLEGIRQSRGRFLPDVRQAAQEDGRLMNGYIKLYRSSLEKGWLSNHKLWAFWSWCLLKASHQETTQIVGYEQVRLMPGDFIFGRKNAVKELKLTERNIRTCLKMLKAYGSLTIRTTSRYSIISIVNWGHFQSHEELGDQPDDLPTTSSRPADDHKQEGKNRRRDISSDSHDEKLPYRGIIDCLNETTGKAFSPSSKATRRLIKARWNEGFRLHDFLTVITTMTAEWSHDAKMAKYLRPETLFGPKFEAYLNTEAR